MVNLAVTRQKAVLSQENQSVFHHVALLYAHSNVTAFHTATRGQAGQIPIEVPVAIVKQLVHIVKGEFSIVLEDTARILGIVTPLTVSHGRRRDLLRLARVRTVLIEIAGVIVGIAVAVKSNVALVAATLPQVTGGCPDFVAFPRRQSSMHCFALAGMCFLGRPLPFAPLQLLPGLPVLRGGGRNAAVFSPARRARHPFSKYREK